MIKKKKKLRGEDGGNKKNILFSGRIEKNKHTENVESFEFCKVVTISDETVKKEMTSKFIFISTTYNIPSKINYFFFFS